MIPSNAQFGGRRMTRLTNFMYNIYLEEDTQNSELTSDPNEKKISLYVHCYNDQDAILIMDDLMRALIETNRVFDCRADIRKKAQK